jgi:hypothetical protein
VERREINFTLVDTYGIMKITYLSYKLFRNFNSRNKYFICVYDGVNWKNKKKGGVCVFFGVLRGAITALVSPPP